MNELRSPLAKAKGLGAAHDATHHFWLQRLTALALIPLALWFGLSIAMLPEASYSAVVGWLRSPFNTVMMVLVVITGFQHAQLGMQVIFEDYIASYPKRLFAILTVKFISYFFMAVGVYCLLKIALGGQ